MAIGLLLIEYLDAQPCFSEVVKVDVEGDVQTVVGQC